MPWPDTVTLSSDRVTLAPLDRRHLEGLRTAVADGELWALWYTFVPTPDAMGSEIERRLKLRDTGSMLPFTVIENATGEP
ncbi:MAG TPA: GNAT family N-acetyltransferase, partial [Pseudomonadales bacterium]|nr:GNAT family N-acetyltransferase [Pseudomonadales bacterium]